MGLPTPAAGLEDRIRRERARVERALAFAREVSMGVRADFPDIFGRPQAWEETSRERELMRRVHTMDRIAHDTAGALRLVPQDASLEALQKFEEFDLGTLADAANRAQQLADHLRQVGKEAPATDTRPAPKPVKSQGPDVAMIRGLAPRSTTQKLGPAVGRPPVAPPRPGTSGLRPPRPGGDAFMRSGGGSPDDRTGVGARRSFEQALKLARDVMAYVSPRLTLADVALEATGMPSARKPWPQVETALMPAAEQAGVSPPLRPWLPLLAKLFMGDLEATRKTHQAVTQWKQAYQLNQHAAKVEGMIAKSPPVSHAALIGSVDTARLRAAVYPLSHLHLHFKGVQHMSTLFPPPA